MGFWKVFHENDQLLSRENYIDGKEDGLFENFDENGNLSITLTYRNGELVEMNRNPQPVFKTRHTEVVEIPTSDGIFRTLDW